MIIDEKMAVNENARKFDRMLIYKEPVSQTSWGPVTFIHPCADASVKIIQ